jgi:hypothetical protein
VVFVLGASVGDFYFLFGGERHGSK